ncbi:MAG: septal ring lytic transglycosylase RlpA family protein, partial [Pusillimonas sp.]
MSLSRSSIATFALCSAAILAGCSTTGPTHRGAYYQNDGPGANPPTDIDAIPDAVPRIETYSKAASKPYTVFGKRYVPITDDRPFRQEGIASWYGRQFHGGKTSDGETYDMYAMTAAHPTLPIPSYARVTNTDNGKSVVVRVNDRGPFHSSRIMDLSYVAAAKLGIIGPGSAPVIVQAITNSDIARGIGTRTASAATPTATQLTASTQTPEVRPAASESR